ncbi:MAG: diguanylate cyclase [Rhodocyclaceae bacterium]|nr:diguanylate cyclase [Rhodocyclaceae bacterium]
MSEKSLSPSEIAREALRQLALRRIPPTPNNFRALYHEIAGSPVSEAFPEKSLKSLLAALPRKTPEQLRFARQLEKAIQDNSWSLLQTALTELIEHAAAPEPSWGGLMRELLTRLETPQAELPVARKREALDFVLASAGSNEALYARLQSLIKSWAQTADHEESLDGHRESSLSPSAAPSQPIDEWLELAAQLLDAIADMLVDDQARLAQEARALAEKARKADANQSSQSFLDDLKRFAYRLHFGAEDHHELRAGIAHLLRLVVENIQELTLDDQWLHGQIAAVMDLLNQPLDLRRIDDIERRLKDVIVKQSTLKKNLLDAQQRIKTMLATFIDRLADFTASTGEYHDKLERCAERIGAAKDIAEITSVLDEAMRETRAMQHTVQRSQAELAEMREKVAQAEKEIARLRAELAQASELVRHDPLTGVLNRKGLAEAVETEMARMRRHGLPLCLALLDVDNFKKLNDSLGHAAGDAALVHLAQVASKAIRPEDRLARYGGEEFVVVLPNTRLEDAVKVMTRVQRELTKHFFLHENQKILITFSCGVAELGADESFEAALARADGAMYLAKRAGKNRVMAA